MKNLSKWIEIIAFLAVLFGLSIAFFLLPDCSFSEEENRGLRTLPEVSWGSIVSGEYTSEFNDYFADQFPLRNVWVGQKGIAEILLGKGENNGVLIGNDGQLAKRAFDIKVADGSVVEDMDSFDAAHIKASIEGINRLAKSLEIPFFVMLTGRSIDVASSAFSYPSAYSNQLLSVVNESVSSKVDYLDTVSLLREKFDSGEYVYYKTDHHWTTLGAYYAYCEAMRSFGMGGSILPQSYFQKELVEESFYGTNWSAGGMKFVSPDRLELWRGEDEELYTVIADGKRLDGFYQLDYLTKKDKYSVFLDGTHDVVSIRRSDGSERPVLLMLKDSFGNSIAPFLARHFDLVLLNLSSARNDFTNVSSLAEEYEAERVLLVYTLENVITADKLCRLK